MNPVTQGLLEQLDDPAVGRFVGDWDELEALVIAVYQGDAASPELERAFRDLKARLGKSYAPLHKRLDAFWRAEGIQGKALAEDPYAWLIGQPAAAAFAGNWAAMQTLPPAREALNNMLLAQIGGEQRK